MAGETASHGRAWMVRRDATLRGSGVGGRAGQPGPSPRRHVGTQANRLEIPRVRPSPGRADRDRNGRSGQMERRPTASQPQSCKGAEADQSPGGCHHPAPQEGYGKRGTWITSQAADVLADVAERPGPAAIDIAAASAGVPPAQKLDDPLRVAEVLAHLDGETRRKAIAILLEQLREPDPTSQLLAATALKRFGPEAREAVEILGGRVESGDIESRIANLYLIGQLGPVASTAVPTIVRTMTSADAEKYGFFPLNRFLNSGWDHRNPILDREDHGSELSTLPGMGPWSSGRSAPMRSGKPSKCSWQCPAMRMSCEA